MTDTTTSKTPRTREALTLDDRGGMWVVRSSSPTVYVVDLRSAPQLNRLRGPGSSSGVGDGQFVPLVQMRDVAVGSRGYYVTDPDGGLGDHQWWLQRQITGIEAISDADLPALVDAVNAGTTGTPRPPESVTEMRTRKTHIEAWLERRGVTGDNAALAEALDERVMFARAELDRIDAELARRTV